MLEQLDTLMRALGAWGYPGLGLAALVEYLFPPFPGDTLVVLGGAWAGRGEHSLWGALVALTLGSLVGMSLTWRLGRGLAGRLKTAPESARVLGLPVGQIRKTQTLMREKGGWLLLFNRFLPSFRSVLFVAAGASEVPLGRTLLLGGVSSLAFNALLLGAGAGGGRQRRGHRRLPPHLPHRQRDGHRAGGAGVARPFPLAARVRHSRSHEVVRAPGSCCSRCWRAVAASRARWSRSSWGCACSRAELDFGRALEGTTRKVETLTLTAATRAAISVGLSTDAPFDVAHRDGGARRR